MARFPFRNFSELHFIQQVDKPRFLVPLLRPYADYFRRRGVEIAELTNTDEHDRRLLEVLGAADDGFPTALLETLYLLDDLADEAGHDRILAEVERQQITLRGILGDELSPGEFAIGVYQKYPQLVREAHRYTPYRKVKYYEEYQAKTYRPITFTDASEKLAGLESLLLGPWFESKNRSRACKVTVYQEWNDLWFEITHGGLYRTVGTITTQLERSRVRYRPQQHDIVIFDTQDCLLKVNAQSEIERDLYRQAFGMAFFDDEDHFPLTELYSLAPLTQGGLKLATVAGVESARLTEVRIYLDDEHGFVHVAQGHDLLAADRSGVNPRLAGGNIVGASFHLTYESGGPPRKLEIRPPNVALYDRARDAEPTKEFLVANRFLVRQQR